MHHRTIHMNHQPDATVFQFIILAFVYSSTCFGRFPAHHQEHDCSGSLWFYLRIVVTVVLLMMGGKTPETCWAVNKRQNNKLENCSIWLVIYLNCTVMMHGLTNLIFMFIAVNLCRSRTYLTCALQCTQKPNCVSAGILSVTVKFRCKNVWNCGQLIIYFMPETIFSP